MKLLIAILLMFAAVASAQLPPMPVADTNVGPNVVTNHVCEARLPVIWLSWKSPTNWVPARYRIYSHTNPIAKPSTFTWYADIPATHTNFVVHTVGESRVFYVTAVATNGQEFPNVRQ